MPAPVPNVIGSPFELSDLPVGGTQALSCTPIAGATYLWQLIERPPGSSAYLTNESTAAPTLASIDQRGTYIVFLTVTTSEGSSHPQPYPVQASVAPYNFTTPLTTAFAVVRVKETSGLVKPGRGEYGWFEGSLWPLVDKVNDGLTFSRYDDPTRTLTANAVVPDNSVAPSNNSVAIAGLSVRNDTANTEHELYSTHDKINVLSHLHVSNKDVTVSGGVIKADDITDASGGDLDIAANATLRLSAGTAMDVSAPEMVLETADELLLRSGDGDIALEATSATGNVTVTAGVQLSLTAPTSTLTASGGTASLVGTTAAVTGTTAVNLTTDNGNMVLSVGGDAVNETVDRAAQITFTADNRRRIIDLDGFVSQKNHIATKGGATYPITVLPANAPALVPFRDNVTMSYRNEALEGPSALPDFTLSFHASFNVTGFTTIGGNNLTFSWVAYDSSDPSERVTLATFNFTPGGSLEVTDRPCVIQGMVHSVGGKSVYCSGMASLQISATTNVTTLSAALANATDVFVNDGIVVFAFLVNSIDTNVTVTNLTGVCSLLRGS